uniref:Endogenous retrovirus group K member 6 Gag polyprotein-like n=1 Tax=Phascolarctos cinereus TaxID=38626 RepID=A0A6P5IMW1_PHACI|nr:endogenous retrovirus group K member 6 Gag polyprotein-like [Phascolarctos cinereus]
MLNLGIPEMKLLGIRLIDSLSCEHKSTFIEIPLVGGWEEVKGGSGDVRSPAPRGGGVPEGPSPGQVAPEQGLEIEVPLRGPRQVRVSTLSPVKERKGPTAYADRGCIEGKMGARYSKGITPEDKRVLVLQVYKLCRDNGVKIQLRRCQEWVEKLIVVSPWLQNQGIDYQRWKIVGSQMSSYAETEPGFLKPEDFTLYGIVTFALSPRPPPVIVAEETQVGTSLLGGEQDLEGQEEPWPEPPKPSEIPSAPWPSLEPLPPEPLPPEPLPMCQWQQKKEVPPVAQLEFQKEEVPPVAQLEMQIQQLQTQINQMQLDKRGKNEQTPQTSLLQHSLREAARDGQVVDWKEWGQEFPIFVQGGAGGGGRAHRPMPYKFMKDLKEAVKLYGAGSSYVKQLLQSTVAVAAWTPGDWDEIMSAVLESAAYTAWSAYRRRESRTWAEANFPQNVEDTINMLTGYGQHAGLQAQLLLPDLVIQGAQIVALKALDRLGEKSQPPLNKLVQRPKESAMEFASRAQEVVEKRYGAGDVAQKLLIQLFKEGLKQSRGLLSKLPPDPTWEECIDVCLEEGPLPDAGMIQVLTEAFAAVQATTQRKKKQTCFRCGKVGHFRSQCLQGGPQVRCFKCGKTGHVQKFCRLRWTEPRRREIERESVDMQGNGQRVP